MQIIAAFDNRRDADSAAGLLQDVGISAALMMDDAVASVREPPAARVRVAVRDEDADRAATTLRAAKLLPQD